MGEIGVCVSGTDRWGRKWVAASQCAGLQTCIVLPPCRAVWACQVSWHVSLPPPPRAWSVRLPSGPLTLLWDHRPASNAAARTDGTAQ